MRHNFVNDIGDYGKYALLRAICSSGPTRVRLGVIWYLTAHTESNGHGRRRPHLSGEGWDSLDPDLLAQMRKIEDSLRSEEDLRLSLIEQSGILPPDTRFFSEALPVLGGTTLAKKEQRASWFVRAQEAIAGCNLLFLDPDNGLETPSAAKTPRLAGKYVTVDEMVTLLTSGAGVVLYQHSDRSPWARQRDRVVSQITFRLDTPPAVHSLRFGAFGSRAFICMATRRDMAETIRAGLNTLRRRVEHWPKAHYLTVE